MEKKHNELISDLKEKARRIRVLVVKMASMSDCHTGGAMSIADILSTLYFHVMKVDPKNPDWDGRDYFILSKGRHLP
jgi:transketolase